MSWAGLVQIIKDVAGPELAERIEARARDELGGARITIKRARAVTLEDIDRVAPGNPEQAAKLLGVSKRTVYRHLHSRRVR